MDILGLHYVALETGYVYTKEWNHHRGHEVKEKLLRIAPVFDSRHLTVIPFADIGQYVGYTVYDGQPTTTIGGRAGVKIKLKVDDWLFAEGKYYYRFMANENWLHAGIGLAPQVGRFRLTIVVGRWANQTPRYTLKLPYNLETTTPSYWFYGSYYTIRLDCGRFFASYTFRDSDGAVKHSRFLWWDVTVRQPSQYELQIGWRF